ncbi:hypothetical protein LOAG_14003, partial [Loa loa]
YHYYFVINAHPFRLTIRMRTKIFYELSVNKKKEVLSAKSFSQDVLQQVYWEDNIGRHLVFGPLFVHINIIIVEFLFINGKTTTVIEAQRGNVNDKVPLLPIGDGV